MTESQETRARQQGRQSERRRSSCMGGTQVRTQNGDLEPNPLTGRVVLNGHKPLEGRERFTLHDFLLVGVVQFAPSAQQYVPRIARPAATVYASATVRGYAKVFV